MVAAIINGPPAGISPAHAEATPARDGAHADAQTTGPAIRQQAQPVAACKAFSLVDQRITARCLGSRPPSSRSPARSPRAFAAFVFAAPAERRGAPTASRDVPPRSAQYLAQVVQFVAGNVSRARDPSPLLPAAASASRSTQIDQPVAFAAGRGTGQRRANVPGGQAWGAAVATNRVASSATQHRFAVANRRTMQAAVAPHSTHQAAALASNRRRAGAACVRHGFFSSAPAATVWAARCRFARDQRARHRAGQQQARATTLQLLLSLSAPSPIACSLPSSIEEQPEAVVLAYAALRSVMVAVGAAAPIKPAD